jgi:hypothetical protein
LSPAVLAGTWAPAAPFDEEMATHGKSKRARAPTSAQEHVALMKSCRDQVAKLRRLRAAIQQTCTTCEEYEAGAAERRAKVDEPTH